MILEVATLFIKKGESQLFEADFKIAIQFLCQISGYQSHSLQKCVEQDDKYILLVNWDKLEDHTIGFRQSPQYLEWKKLLHHYFIPSPIVEHYEAI